MKKNNFVTVTVNFDQVLFILTINYRHDFTFCFYIPKMLSQLEHKFYQFLYTLDHSPQAVRTHPWKYEKNLWQILPFLLYIKLLLHFINMIGSFEVSAGSWSEK